MTDIKEMIEEVQAEIDGAKERLRALRAMEYFEDRCHRFVCECASAVVHLWVAPEELVKYLRASDEYWPDKEKLKRDAEASLGYCGTGNAAYKASYSALKAPPLEAAAKSAEYAAEALRLASELGSHQEDHHEAPGCPARLEERPEETAEEKS